MATETTVSAEDMLVLEFIRRPGFFQLTQGTRGGVAGVPFEVRWQIGAVSPASKTGGVCWGEGPPSLPQFTTGTASGVRRAALACGNP